MPSVSVSSHFVRKLLSTLHTYRHIMTSDRLRYMDHGSELLLFSDNGFAFIALILLAGHQEEHLACKNEW